MSFCLKQISQNGFSNPLTLSNLFIYSLLHYIRVIAVCKRVCLVLLQKAMRCYDPPSFPRILLRLSFHTASFPWFSWASLAGDRQISRVPEGFKAEKSSTVIWTAERRKEKEPQTPAVERTGGRTPGKVKVPRLSSQTARYSRTDLSLSRWLKIKFQSLRSSHGMQWYVLKALPDTRRPTA